MNSDLIERLRSTDNALDAVDEAANEIERLRARIARIETLQSALRNAWHLFVSGGGNGLAQLGDAIGRVIEA